MPVKKPECAQTCKSLCTAIESASRGEKEAILLYGQFRDQCTYPDVQIMLNELIIQKTRSIELLERTKKALKSKFEVLDQIRQGFEG